MTATVTPTASSISVRGVTKTYPGVLALKPVDLDIRAGSIHALVGENGAGKSTLLKIIAGAQPPSGGALLVYGEEVSHASPRQARRLGVMAVYQELTVVPNLTAMENVFLGQTPSRAGLVDVAAMREAYTELTDRMGVSIPPGTKAGSVSIADQQVLEILRALQAEARVLLLDEPTASLAMHEREALGKVMLALATQGVTIIWISHDLDEVLSLSDDVSVFRDGTYIETRPAAKWTKTDLVAAMLGDRDRVVPFERVHSASSTAIKVRDLSVPGVLDQVSFDVRESEILGIAGLVGSGRTELLRALAGLDPTASGTLEIGDHSASLPTSPRDAARRRIALAPEDRKAQGLVLSMTTAENLCVPMWKRLRRRGLLLGRPCTTYAKRVASKVGLSSNYLGRAVRTLSGGNQQKAVLGKWSECDLHLFLVDEPTRGIDINAKAEVYRLLDTATRSGMSVLLVSSEFEELVEVCDRVLVLAGGTIVKEVHSPDISEEEILHSIFEVTR
jgi:ABC-type sugar transport system ATPase subunit